jgi:hypothetical protein
LWWAVNSRGIFWLTKNSRVHDKYSPDGFKIPPIFGRQIWIQPVEKWRLLHLFMPWIKISPFCDIFITTRKMLFQAMESLNASLIHICWLIRKSYNLCFTGFRFQMISLIVSWCFLFTFNSKMFLYNLECVSDQYSGRLIWNKKEWEYFKTWITESSIK